MTVNNSPKRPAAPSGAPGVKIFLTAASLTAIVSGWAGFTMQQSGWVQAEPAPETAQVSLEFPPMPTLVSAPGATAVGPAPLATPRSVSIGGSGSSGSGGGQTGLPPASVRQPRVPVTRTGSSH